MEFTYQIFTGNFYSPVPETPPAQVLREAYKLTGAGDVIIGCNTQNDCYREVIDIAHGAGKNCWLWLPVFSELPEDTKPEYATDLYSNVQRGKSVIPGENFRFVCPSSLHNQDISFNLYVKHFSGLRFDGVFLDKIRHASFAGGFSEGFGCFCESCRANYAKRGVNIEEISAMIRENAADFLPCSARPYSFSNPAAAAFYAAKADIITSAVLRISEKFENIGLKTALDVFMPMFAYFTGQDIPALSSKASFIKPMCYRITHAPAGIPYEIDGMRETFAQSGADVKNLLLRLWETDDLCSFNCAQTQLNLLSCCEVRPGFEINFVEGICESGANYVTETAESLKNAGIKNAALCWNLLSPGALENLKALS
ncbi:MAG: hypothetical protein LBS21_07490 [Clostridiales bacterium]|jgi:hypothetical protein|nr:hypothetical protein [Clostridiales bacterium]